MGDCPALTAALLRAVGEANSQPGLVQKTATNIMIAQECGVVWCGVVWCGVVWCGVVWCAVSGAASGSSRLSPFTMENRRLWVLSAHCGSEFCDLDAKAALDGGGGVAGLYEDNGVKRP